MTSASVTVSTGEERQDVGDLIQVRVVIRDITVPDRPVVDPEAVTVQVRPPGDGVPFSVETTRESEGVYTAAFTASSSGVWRYRAIAEGDYAGFSPDGLVAVMPSAFTADDVAPPPPLEDGYVPLYVIDGDPTPDVVYAATADGVFSPVGLPGGGGGASEPVLVAEASAVWANGAAAGTEQIVTLDLPDVRPAGAALEVLARNPSTETALVVGSQAQWPDNSWAEGDAAIIPADNGDGTWVVLSLAPGAGRLSLRTYVALTTGFTADVAVWMQ